MGVGLKFEWEAGKAKPSKCEIALQFSKSIEIGTGGPVVFGFSETKALKLEHDEAAFQAAL
jgi:hypothetical protein